MRPYVGLSQFNETVIENSKYVRENLGTFDVEAIKRFLNKADDILESLQVINQKDKSANAKTISSNCI